MRASLRLLAAASGRRTYLDAFDPTVDALRELIALRVLPAMECLAPAAEADAPVRTAPFGLLAVDELRRLIATYPYDGRWQRSRARPDTPPHAEAALREALDSASPAGVARALSDAFKVVPLPQSYGWQAVAAAGGKAPPPEPATLAAVATLHGLMARAFAHALAPVPLVLGALRELAAGGDSVVRQECVLHALQARVDAGARERYRDAALDTLPHLGLLGRDAAVELFGLAAAPPDGGAPWLTPVHDLAFVSGLLRRRSMKDAVRFLTRPVQAPLLDVLAATPAPPLPPPRWRAAAPVDGPAGTDAPTADADALAAPLTLLETLYSQLIAGGKHDLLRALVRGHPDREVALIRSVHRALGRHALAARLARDFRVDLDALPDVRRAMKRATLSGLLRLPARDVVLTRARTDGEAREELAGYVDERVALGKTPPQAAHVFWEAVAGFDAAEARRNAAAAAGNGGGGVAYSTAGECEVEAALARVDAAAHALYRPKGSKAAAGGGGGNGGTSSTTTAPEAPDIDVPADESEPAAAALPPPDFLIPSPIATAALTAYYAGPLVDGAATATTAANAHGVVLIHDEQGYLRLPVEPALARLRGVNSSGGASGVGTLAPQPAVVLGVRTQAQLRSVVAAVHGPASAPARVATPVLGIDCEWVSPLLPTDDEGVAVLTVACGHNVWLVDLPALAAEAASAADQAALNEAFHALFVTPGLTPGKASEGTDAAAATTHLRALVLVYGGATDFKKVASTYPWLTAFAHTTALRDVPVGVAMHAGASGKGAAVPAVPSPLAAGSIAFVDLMTLARTRQLPKLPSQLAPLEQPVPTGNGAEDGDGELPTLPVDAGTPADDGDGGATEVPDGLPDAPAGDAVGADAAAPQPRPQPQQHNDPGSGGLSGLCHRALGRPINKYYQMSAWSRRPLLEGQREYAAIDAWVLPLLLAQLRALPPAVATGAAAPAANGGAGGSRRRKGKGPGKAK